MEMVMGRLVVGVQDVKGSSVCEGGREQSGVQVRE